MKLEVMMFQYRHLSRHASVFQHLTGLRLGEFEALSAEMVPLQQATHHEQLAQREKPRQRAVGAGGQFSLCHRDQLLLTVIWLRRYPTHETGALWAGATCSAWMLPQWGASWHVCCRCSKPAAKPP